MLHAHGWKPPWQSVPWNHGMLRLKGSSRHHLVQSLCHSRVPQAFLQWLCSCSARNRHSWQPCPGQHSPVALGGTSRLTLTKKRMLSPETMEEFTASKSSSPPVSSLASQPSSVSHLRYPARRQKGSAGWHRPEPARLGHTYRLQLPRAASAAPGAWHSLLLNRPLVRGQSQKQSAPDHLWLVDLRCVQKAALEPAQWCEQQNRASASLLRYSQDGHSDWKP